MDENKYRNNIKSLEPDEKKPHIRSTQERTRKKAGENKTYSLLLFILVGHPPFFALKALSLHTLYHEFEALVNFARATRSFRIATTWWRKYCGTCF